MLVVRGFHFVCRNNLNVVDHGDGTFTTKFWKVASKHAETAESVALHESRSSPAYRQGDILRWFPVEYRGQTRVAFVVREVDGPVAWVGDGTGEKGYRWG